MVKRLLEIDALRGLAVALMVLYHFLFDGWFMGLWELDLGHWLIEGVGTVVRLIFLSLVGVSVVFSSRGFGGQLKRGAIVFGGGLLVTLATWVAIPEYMVWFGILHLIGVSIPVARLFKGHPWLAVGGGLAVLLMAPLFVGALWDQPWLLWLGIPYEGFTTVDYFPLVPWLAVPLFGVALGHWVYEKRQPTRLEILARVPALTWMGQHAFPIYLIHQPIIVGLLYLVQISL